MRYAFARSFFALLGFGLILLPALPGRAADEKYQEKVVIPFDFEAGGERGVVLGPSLAEMVWTKIDKAKGAGGLITVEALQDIRDTCSNNGIKVTPATPLEKVKQVVTGDFAGQIGVWGSINLAPGHTEEIYDLVIKCVDFSVDPPKMIYDRSVRTESAGEVPHKYIKEMLDKLYGREPGGKLPPNPAVEARWNDPDNPNLVIGGDFEKVRNGVPIGWESFGGYTKEPLGNLVKWVPEHGNPKNHVIRLTMDKATGDWSGDQYYSLPFPIEAGSTYRFQCRYRTNGPLVKVFIKCYDVMPSVYRPEAMVHGSASRGHGAVSAAQLETMNESREVYRSQQNLKGEKNQWNVQTEDFTPHSPKYIPRTARIDLFCYKGAGVVEFDDVIVKKIKQGSASDIPRPDQRRISSETKVTIKEMQENERRSEELKAAERKAAKEAAKAKEAEKDSGDK